MRSQTSHAWVLLCLMGMLSSAAPAVAEPLLGRAIIASLRGNAHYEWSEGSEPLEEGMALTHGHRIVAAAGASLCVLLTPGALVCVNENSELDLETLEHTAAGLPQPGKPDIRRIALRLGRGAILVHAGAPAPDREISISFDDTTRVLSSGVNCILSNVKGVRHIEVESGSLVVERSGEREVLQAGARMMMTVRPSAGGADTWVVADDAETPSAPPYDFQVCRRFLGPLAPLTLDWEWGNMAAVNEWINPSREVVYVGAPREWQDVSPSLRQTSQSQYPSSMPPTQLSGGGGQWRRPDIWDWYRRAGTVRGANYLPRTAVNTIEMWQEETFDRQAIDEELGWAEKVGLDSVRVFLPYVVWAKDGKGLKARMALFLDLAAAHDLSTVFVLFDNRQSAGTPVGAGPQPAPVAGLHNSRWVASPGHARVPESAGEWPQLKAYVQDVVGSFGDDERVLMWDLYSEAGYSGMGGQSLPLALKAFEWAREVKPDQPLTAGIGRLLPPEARRAIVKHCDVITLADFEDARQMDAMLALMGTYGRPVICTGWLSRGKQNTFQDILPVFSRFGVGWYQWGLAQGRSQLYMPWNAPAGAPVPEVWEQDLLDAEGKPFDEEEINLIRGFSLDAL